LPVTADVIELLTNDQFSVIIDWSVTKISNADTTNDISIAITNMCESYPTGSSLCFLLISKVDIRPNTF